MLDRVEIRLSCWPVHTDDGLLLKELLNHPGTMRSSVVVVEDELESDCTRIRCNVDVQDLIHVGYAGHQTSRHDVQVSYSASADTSPINDGASTIAVTFRDIGPLKSLPTSSPHLSTSICKVKTSLFIGEEYRIPVVISPFDLILCPVQTRLFVKSGQGNANECSPRPKTTLPKTVTNCLRGNVKNNSIPQSIS